jgi:stage II sporulation protein M
MKAHLRDLWMSTRVFLLISALVLVLGMVLGFAEAEAVDTYMQPMMKQLEGIIKELQKDPSPVNAFWLIFQKNVLSTFTMMALGIFFGIYPLFGVLVNGTLLGYVLAKYHLAGIDWYLVFAAGILPHGIFEFPALLFAAAVGIRHGGLLMRSIGLLWGANSSKGVGQEWKKAMVHLPYSLGIVVVLLFVAAIVESVITPYLLSETIGTSNPFQ